MKQKLKLVFLVAGLIIGSHQNAYCAPNWSSDIVYQPFFENEKFCPKDFCRAPDDGWSFKNFCSMYENRGDQYITIGRTQYQGVRCSCPCILDYLGS